MFAHIYFLYHPEINKGGWFGYEYWSVFFASMMYPVLFFAFGYFLQRLVTIYIDDSKGLLFANIIIGALYFFSLFYFVITFFPYRNSYARIGLSPFWYYIVAIVSAVIMVLLLIYLPKRYKVEITELKQRVKSLQLSLLNYFNLLQKWEYRTDNHAEFLEDLYGTTKDSNLIK